VSLDATPGKGRSSLAAREMGFGKLEDLNDVAIFVRVAEKSSFTQAARELRLSVPYVSKRIKYLEDTLQAQLFIRSTRHFSLTETGQRYYARCAAILQQLTAVHEEVGELTKGLRGTVRVYSPLGFGELVLPKIIFEFNKIYPDIIVDLRVGEDPASPTEKGVDIAIRTADLADASLLSRELGLLRYRVCASVDFFKGKKLPRRPEELAGYNCLVHPGQPGCDQWTFVDGEEECTLHVTGNLRSNSGVVIYDACEAGVGIARLPEYDARRGLKAGRLVELFPGQLTFARMLRAYYSRSPHTPARIETFLDFLQTRVEFLSTISQPRKGLESRQKRGTPRKAG
jgi:DNA-binding transcriptional LysR family regulator